MPPLYVIGVPGLLPVRLFEKQFALKFLYLIPVDVVLEGSGSTLSHIVVVFHPAVELIADEGVGSVAQSIIIADISAVALCVALILVADAESITVLSIL